jgi:hypothetical protein
MDDVTILQQQAHILILLLKEEMSINQYMGLNIMLTEIQLWGCQCFIKTDVLEEQHTFIHFKRMVIQERLW